MRIARTGVVACVAAVILASCSGGGTPAGGPGADVPKDLAAADPGAARDAVEAVADVAGAGDFADAAEADATEVPGLADAGDLAEDALAADGETSDAATELSSYRGPWQTSLADCWTDVSCRRILLVSHGGDWDENLPYDSQSAFHRAYDKGADAIKTDVLVTMDGKLVVAHTNQIQFYESPECSGQSIDQMTLDQVTACHLATSTTETYQRLDDVLDWAKDKVVLMLTVKSDATFAPAIQAAIAHDAVDRVFVELYFSTLQSLIPTVVDHDKVRYNVQVESFADIQNLVDAAVPQVMLCESDPTWPEADTATMTATIANVIHPAGLKSFVSSENAPTVPMHVALMEAGWDVVMTYDLDNAIQARTQVDQERGVTPP
jgi:glycerophosphoryl diester phosphodiesterase